MNKVILHKIKRAQILGNPLPIDIRVHETFQEELQKFLKGFVPLLPGKAGDRMQAQTSLYSSPLFKDHYIGEVHLSGENLWGELTIGFVVTVTTHDKDEAIEVHPCAIEFPTPEYQNGKIVAGEKEIALPFEDRNCELFNVIIPSIIEINKTQPAIAEELLNSTKRKIEKEITIAEIDTLLFAINMAPTA